MILLPVVALGRSPADILVLDGLTATLIQEFLDHRELTAPLFVASGALASELIVESLGGTLAPLSKRAFQ